MATLVANTRTIGIRGAPLGATVEWRKAGESLRPGPPLDDDFVRGEGRGKLLMLTPGTLYEVVINGASSLIQTRSEAIPKSGGRTLEATPATVGTIVPTLLPGDTLQLRGGLYRYVGPTRLTVSISGTENNYITLEAYPGEEVVFTAADSPPLSWTIFSGPIWSSPLALPASGYKPYSVWQGDHFLWRYTTLADLQVLAKGGKPGGYFYDSTTGTLYIRTVADDSPEGVEWRIYYDTGNDYSSAGPGPLLVTGSYIQVRGLKFQYANESIGLGGVANVVEDCHCYATHYLVRTRSATRAMVRRCTGDGGPGYDTYLRGTYNGWPHGRGIFFPGNRISFEAYQNTFSRFTEGISGFTSGQQSNMEVNPNVDLYDNEIYLCVDDGLEIDGAGVNFAVWNNYIHECYDCCSLAPVKIGPAYIFFNRFINPVARRPTGNFGGTGIKTGGDCNSRVFFFHNTIWVTIKGDGGGNGSSDWTSGRTPTYRFWNNIIRAARYAIAGWRSDWKADYDLLYSTDPNRLITGSNTWNSMAKMQAASGYELHGVQAEPGLVSPPSDVSLRPDSVCKDAGTSGLLTAVGIDVSYFESLRPWGGSAPDLGAQETGGPPGPPLAKFTARPASGPAPLRVSCTDESQGRIDTWEWDFGDGSPLSSERNPTHIYAAPGTYTIRLTVTGPGGPDVATQDIAVSEATAPVAKFTPSVTEGPAPLLVRFTNASLNFTSSSWDFGDGFTSTETSPEHTYTIPGVYRPRLTVVGPGGPATAEATINVQDPIPLADFSADVTEGWAPLPVKFTNKSTGNITGLAWKFGDGVTSGEANPHHIYTRPGEYVATLTVVGPGGSDDNAITITVFPGLTPPPPPPTVITLPTPTPIPVPTVPGGPGMFLDLSGRGRFRGRL